MMQVDTQNNICVLDLHSQAHLEKMCLISAQSSFITKWVANNSCYCIFNTTIANKECCY